LAAAGFALGLFVLFAAIRFSADVIAILHPQGRNADSHYIVINKKVNLRHTLGLGKTAFRPEEIEHLRQQDFVKDVGPIVTTNFAVAGAVRLGISGLQSELFFEAVDDRFLDTRPAGWHWQEGDTQIPAILARDFLALYNFGYAAAKGLPQFTEATLGVLEAQVLCSGEVQQAFTGKIVGFSDRFATILVPMTFMNWANAQIGRKAAPPVARVILEIETGKSEAAEEFLADQSYETNREKLPLKRVARSLQVMLIIVSVFGGVLILVSVLSLVLLIQLIISQARQELRLLHQLGFDDSFLAYTYLTVILPVIAGSFVLAAAGVLALGFALQEVMTKAGLVISPIPGLFTVILFGLTFVGVMLLLYRLITRVIQRIA
jgi:hypothetical protein